MLTTSGRGSGLEPTTAASSFDGCNGLIKAGLTFLADEPFSALAVLAGVLLGADVLVFLGGEFLAASAFVAGASFTAVVPVVLAPVPLAPVLVLLAVVSLATPAFLAAVPFEARALFGLGGHRHSPCVKLGLWLA